MTLGDCVQMEAMTCEMCEREFVRAVTDSRRYLPGELCALCGEPMTIIVNPSIILQLALRKGVHN